VATEKSDDIAKAMKTKIKILIAASEATPLAKVGGLGDVVGALPKALKKLGLDVRLIIPYYGLIKKKRIPCRLIKSRINIQTAVAEETVSLYATKLPASQALVYLIEHDFFKGQDVYGRVSPANRGLYSNSQSQIEKFVFFSHALLVSIKALDWQPDIIHLNDWPTAAVALYLKTLSQNDRFFQNTKTLYTIHNLANQGITNPKIIALNKICPGLTSVIRDRQDQDINLMVQGILNADLINAVSPTYAREILTKEYGAGLEKVLALRKKQLHGILNGLDVDFFNPHTDKLITHRYALATLQKKTANKLTLQKRLGLPMDKKTALVGLIGRLVWQKGSELITEKFSRLNCQFIFLGAGEKKHENALLGLAKKYPKKFSAQIKFDEKLAHQIYAGSDIFLAPSRFEPCGLTQMIAMRYGSVPIVRATGGLKDTVKNFQFPISNFQKKPTGFTFKNFNSQELYQTLAKALRLYYYQPRVWRQLQINGMKQDFSWDKSAKEYLRLYQKLCQ
jgi:starch synthase